MPNWTNFEIFIGQQTHQKCDKITLFDFLDLTVTPSEIPVKYIFLEHISPVIYVNKWND